MSGYKTSAELKQDAKDMLRGRWKDAVLMNLIPSLIVLVAVLVVVVTVVVLSEMWSTGTVPMDDDGGGGGGNSGLGGIFSTLITTGISYAFLDAYRNHDYTFRPLKDAFRVFSKQYFLPVFFIYFLTSVFTFLWGLLLVIPGIIKAIAYSQAYFIYKDHVDRPDPQPISALNCITESRMLMDGHKMRYFTLQLSYLGWILVGALTLGIGFLWINPYITATNTAFYNDLVHGPFVDSDTGWEASTPSQNDRDFENFDF
ncbi:DUF975 family protein [Atopococcus tabaci]|uniref:DUF975 family protein n=1 Tax=Atopococcus tabaci TaxID=269774 RepID=UPI002409F6EE|nr:DUF975 family protein [Atopococcus tabaci]